MVSHRLFLSVWDDTDVELNQIDNFVLEATDCDYIPTTKQVFVNQTTWSM